MVLVAMFAVMVTADDVSLDVNIDVNPTSRKLLGKQLPTEAAVAKPGMPVGLEAAPEEPVEKPEAVAGSGGVEAAEAAEAAGPEAADAAGVLKGSGVKDIGSIQLVLVYSPENGDRRERLPFFSQAASNNG